MTPLHPPVRGRTAAGRGTGRTAVLALLLPVLLLLVGVPAALAADGRLEGTVTGPDGAPVARVCLTTSAQDSSGGHYTLSGEDGTWSMAVPAGAPVLHVERCGTSALVGQQFYDHATRPEDATVLQVTDGGTTHVDVHLDAPAALSGTVTDDAGVPVPDVCVDASGPNDTDRARTDGSGRFAMTALSAGTFRVHYASCDPGGPVASVTATDSVTLAAGEHREGLALRAQRSAQVRTTVTDEAGAPLSGACLDVVPAGSTDGGQRLLPSGSDGVARVA
ncbi:MAG: LPXTG-motif cell wall anchor domain protein, partial [Frankiales bacterium]|nr:LPXTG-motif cell wall anchor domain protein [Frankiales bacterium]